MRRLFEKDQRDEEDIKDDRDLAEVAATEAADYSIAIENFKGAYR